MHGWTGSVLRVDLSKGDYTIENLDLALAKKFVGGRGLGAKILFDEINATIDPFSHENKLIFATGPLTGTRAVTSCRYMVITKSPLTGAIACSNSGGQFGARLKLAGYDMIILEGRASEAVYLSINNDNVKLIPALHLWGKTTHETEDLIRSEIGDTQTARQTYIASIGPAGENLVRIAAIMNDKHRAAARSGVGAVMGSKNLKAIAVRGTGAVTLADENGFKQSVSLAREHIRNSKAMQVMTDCGTHFLVDIASSAGIIPARNFQTGVFPGASKINSDSFIESSIITGRKACFSCPIGCGRVTRITDPNFEGEGEGPEYETIALLGACCGIDNPFAIAKAGYICNELGIDTISAGATIACAMELYEKGYLPEEDVGFQLNFGNAEAMVKLVEAMGKRQGFGDELAEGSYRLAKKYGHPELSMVSKKQEIPGYEPRGLQEKALAYATSNRGACHMRARPLGKELENPSATKGVASLLKGGQDYMAVLDACGLCSLIRGVIKIDELLPMLEAATGAGYDKESLLLTGERIWNLERLFNLEAGLAKRDDSLPKRMLEEPMPEGPAKGQVAQLDLMLPEYYQVRGWNADGVPTQDKLIELGLETTTNKEE